MKTKLKSGSYFEIVDVTNASLFKAGGDGSVTITGNLLASKIITTGGTSNEVLCADGSTIGSKNAVNNGTEVSLVTTGEKYLWNNIALSDSTPLFHHDIYFDYPFGATGGLHISLYNRSATPITTLSELVAAFPVGWLVAQYTSTSGSGIAILNKASSSATAITGYAFYPSSNTGGSTVTAGASGTITSSSITDTITLM